MKCLTNDNDDSSFILNVCQYFSNFFNFKYTFCSCCWSLNFLYVVFMKTKKKKRHKEDKIMEIEWLVEVLMQKNKNYGQMLVEMSAENTFDWQVFSFKFSYRLNAHKTPVWEDSHHRIVSLEISTSVTFCQCEFSRKFPCFKIL